MKNQLSRLIERLKVSAYKFAKDTGIPQNTIYSLKNAPNRFPSGDVFDRIIKAYPEVTPNDIVSYGDSNHE